MKKYECIRSCLPFVQGDVYQGREIVFDVFGTKVECYEMYPHDREHYIIVPCDRFKEIKQ
ncbi:hypothetical protein [Turicibacter sanguinis]|uniref:hypothetical protein n=1 Tax=Turicibacter sanguinis TaxID=154288 RepID=UPI0018A96B53|nr:hypothetical protein [Turicibacter sanguinis]MDB8552172.1 hypothetical protein [Turicibacter sanguinis]